MRWLAVALMLLLCACNGKTVVSKAIDASTPHPTTTPSATVDARPPTIPPSPPPAAVRGYSVRRVSARDLLHSWHAGCPVDPAQLRMLTVPYLGFDGLRHQGRLVVRSGVTGVLGRTFVRLFDEGFPIRSIRPVDDFGGDDDRSMAADNTSAFNCRAAVGSSGTWSQHAYGLAVDINPLENPYVYGGKVDPPAGQAYVTRTPVRKGMIVADGVALRAFGDIGWGWGGRWSSSKDYQHLSANGR